MTASQKPIGSGFDAASTASDVINGTDLSNRVAIVTGGYSGVGLETTRALFSAGAEVIVPARDRAKAVSALERLDDVEIEGMDLLDPTSIDAFAERFLASGRPLHILVNNAGIMACPLARDARGYESQFATNHLGHFQLVARLWPALRQANGARVVSVSSWGRRHSPVVFEDPNFTRRDYDRWSAYGQSKTANILFALRAGPARQSRGRACLLSSPGQHRRHRFRKASFARGTPERRRHRPKRESCARPGKEPQNGGAWGGLLSVNKTLTYLFDLP